MVNDTFSPEFVIVSAKDIAERAHEIYVDRGYADGLDREDWLRAEHELKNPQRDDEARAVETSDGHLLLDRRQSCVYN
jgi:Protein of unknown function (DUF2934)